MKYTYKELLEAGLETTGWTKERTNSYKIAGWTKPGQSKVFVGPAGGLRAGQCKSQSYSIGDPSSQTAIYKSLLAAGQEKLNKEQNLAPHLASYIGLI